MSITISSRIRHHEREIADTHRLEADEDRARELARDHNRPVILLHNTRPGKLAECHVRAFSARGFHHAESLLRSHLVLVYDSESEILRAMRAVDRVSAENAAIQDPANVLVRAFRPDGTRISQ